MAYCTQCGGTGYMKELSGECSVERRVVCMACKRYCHGCKSWVDKGEHTCPSAKW